MKKRMIAATLLGIVWIGHALGKEDVPDLIAQAEKVSQSVTDDAKALVKSLGITKGKACHANEMNPKALSRCAMNLFPPPLKKAAPHKDELNHTQLFIFVSASMPPQSIKTLGKAAQKIGARVVFPGLVGGTFQHTQSYMKSLDIAVEIDPTKFQDYQITKVPAFVLIHNKNFDRVTGHISLWEALNQFRQKGDLKADAHKLHHLLKQHSSQGVRS